MTPADHKRAKELSANVAAFSQAKRPVLSMYSKRPATMSDRIAALGAPKAPKVIEKPIYMGKPGEKGDKGEKGDSIKGKDGKNGRDGKDGLTPVKGVHYFTPKEVEAMKKEIMDAIVMPETPEVPEKLEVNAELVKKIIQIMHTLPETDKLEVSKGIRNASSFIFGKTKYETSELMHGGGASTGGGTTPLTPVGVVDASNTVFGVVSEPSSVISDGITYFEGFGYSYAALSITLDVPPSQYIKYYA